MLVCRICGSIWEEAEARRTSHMVGEQFGEEYYRCPCCNSADLVEAAQCEICGEWFEGRDGIDVCDDCIKNAEDVGTALEYGEGAMETVAVNGAIYNLLSEKEINAILTKYVEEHFTDHSKPIAHYCEEDKRSFAEWLIERKGD